VVFDALAPAWSERVTITVITNPALGEWPMMRIAPLLLLGSGSRTIRRGSAAASNVHSGSTPVAPG